MKDSIAERKSGYKYVHSNSLSHKRNHSRGYMGNTCVLLEVPDIGCTEHVQAPGEHVCRKANLSTKCGCTDPPQKLKLPFWKIKTSGLGKGKFRR